MTKNVSTHVTSVISAAASLVTLIHPGFTVPPFVQGLFVTVTALISAGVEFAHMNHKHQMQAIERMAAQAADAVKSNKNKPA